jgi:kanamycin nucleotidyltransferase
MEREDRLRLARRIAERLVEVHGVDLVAVGLYGSLARGTDGPFSDIEMWCVLRPKGIDLSHEWSVGPWKAEVDVMSEDSLLHRAAEVDYDWALTHGAFEHVLPLHDPTGFFDRLREVATGQPKAKFRAAIEATLVEELYEHVGKLRNARWRGEAAPLPLLAVDLAREGAFVIGLHARRTFTSGGRLLEEALALPDRPAGFDELATRVVRGELTEPEAIHASCEAFWVGMCRWADRHHYRMLTERSIPF